MSYIKELLIERQLEEEKPFFEQEEYGYGEPPITSVSYEERQITGFPDYYISNRGDAISYRNNKRIVMATWTNQHGHKYTRLVDRNGNRKTVLVHRLVAQEFIPNCFNGKVVRHLNDDPNDNRVENLDWGSQTDNIYDMRKNGHMYMIPVYCLELDKEFESCKEAADYVNADKSSITMNCRGMVHSVGGYHFCYLKEKDNKKWDLQVGVMKKPVKAINTATGEELYFDSRKDAGNLLGIPNCGISSVLTGHLEHTHGWKFEEAEVRT